MMISSSVYAASILYVAEGGGKMDNQWIGTILIFLDFIVRFIIIGPFMYYSIFHFFIVPFIFIKFQFWSMLQIFLKTCA